MDDVKLVHFHNFESLTTTRGEMVESPEFECAGHKWKLQIYPGGHEDSDDGNIAVGLYCVIQPSERFYADHCINIKKNNATNFFDDSECFLYPYVGRFYEQPFSAGDHERLWVDFASRSDVLKTASRSLMER